MTRQPGNTTLASLELLARQNTAASKPTTVVGVLQRKVTGLHRRLRLPAGIPEPAQERPELN
jgi:hypothetical protein